MLEVYFSIFRGHVPGVMIAALAFLAASFTPEGCGAVLNIPENCVMRLSRTLHNGETFCFEGDRHLYVVFHKFDDCEMTVSYISKSRSDHVARLEAFDAHNFTQPFVDFGDYHGVFTVRARNDDTLAMFHVIRTSLSCTDRLYITNKATNSVQFNSRWPGDTALFPNQRLCLFLCPYGAFRALNVLYHIGPDPTSVSIIYDGLNSTVLTGNSSNETRSYQTATAYPLYVYFASADGLDPSWFRVSYEGDNNVTPTTQIDGFFSVFNQQFKEPLSTWAIVGIAAGSAVAVIGLAIAIILLIIWRRRKRLRGMRARGRRHRRTAQVSAVKDERQPAVGEKVKIARTFEEAEPIEFHYEVPTDLQTSAEGIGGLDEDFESVEVEIASTMSFFFEVATVEPEPC
jgi:hypothetical protein